MSKDFTPFLKYIPNATSDWLPPVGEGWHAIVHDLLSEIDKIVAEHTVLIFVVDQIKEKFGGLRVYCRVDQLAPDDVRQHISEIVNKHSTRASSTCEQCGAPGRIGSYFTGYYRALCRPHAIAHLREGVQNVPKYQSWSIRLFDGGLEITDIRGTLLTDSGVQAIEIKLAAPLSSQHELNAFRDARYLAGRWSVDDK